MARRLVEAAARRELAWVAGHVGRADGAAVLADRLARRLGEQMRLGAPIADPVGWLMGRALPRRQDCAEPRCDDGVLLGSGRDGPRCEDRQLDRRAQRCAVAASVDAAMPGAPEAERRAATERQLHRDVMARAWAREREWAQVRAWQAVVAARAEAAAAAARPEENVSVVAPAPVVLPAPRSAAVAPEPEQESEFEGIDDDQELVLEDLTREQLLDWRNRAAADHQIVHDHIARYGEHSAQRLFTRVLVATVQRLSGLEHLELGYTPWGRA
ncbi:hypothetical protein ACFVT2_39840 [Streptomyces sp. NPDC058000]|uniref:hypothetical protein n=1 Tax=Streptomyces sp. NPDC058000 TaxID=3346299 RepID=UPI0036F0F54C